MSRRRRLDGEMHLGFGICHGRLMLALLATGVRVASIIPSLGGPRYSMTEAAPRT
jgi:hypothetical protein